MPKRKDDKTHRTYQTRLQGLSSDALSALDAYADLYGQVERTLYAETLAKRIKPESVKSAYLKRFEITARQFNAICRNLKGKVQSIKALNKDHIKEGEQRIKKARGVIARLERKINRAPQAVDRKKWFQQLHQKKRRLATLESRHDKRVADQKAGNTRLCFGSKRLFRAQFNLEKSGFSSHEDWRRTWQSRRSSQFYVLGSKDETAGCQSCVATKSQTSDEGFVLRLRLPDALESQHSKFLQIPIRLEYGRDVLAQALMNGCAINYRFLRDDKGWRVFITTSAIAISVTSTKALGAIGVDINADHLAVSEIDHNGNPIERLRIPLCTYGKNSEQAKALIGDAVKHLMAFCNGKKKPVVIEDLDFAKKKTQLEAADKRYARMLSSLSYNKVITIIKARAHDLGIEVIERNPAYTSIIGKAKFMRRYGLSSHQAAACAIARRGLNFSERPNRRDQLAPLLPVRNRQGHVWSYWRKAKPKLAGLAALSALGLLPQSAPT